MAENQQAFPLAAGGCYDKWAVSREPNTPLIEEYALNHNIRPPVI